MRKKPNDEDQLARSIEHWLGTNFSHHKFYASTGVAHDIPEAAAYGPPNTLHDIARVFVNEVAARTATHRADEDDSEWADSFISRRDSGPQGPAASAMTTARCPTIKTGYITDFPSITPSTMPELFDATANPRARIAETAEEADHLPEDEGPGDEHWQPRGLDSDDEEGPSAPVHNADSDFTDETMQARITLNRAAAVERKQRRAEAHKINNDEPGHHLTEEQLHSIERSRNAAIARRKRRREAEAQLILQGLAAAPATTHQSEGVITHTRRIQLNNFP